MNRQTNSVYQHKKECEQNMGLGMIAQVLAALFVLFSGLWALLPLVGVTAATTALTWLVGVLGVLGGLVWLAVSVSGGKK